MKKGRVKLVKKFMVKYVKAGRCSCCKQQSLLRFKFNKIKVCIKCLKVAIFLMEGGKANSVVQDKRPVIQLPEEKPYKPGKLVRLPDEEIKEMRRGSVPKKPKDGFDWGNPQE